VGLPSTLAFKPGNCPGADVRLVAIAQGSSATMERFDLKKGPIGEERSIKRSMYSVGKGVSLGAAGITKGIW